ERDADRKANAMSHIARHDPLLVAARLALRAAVVVIAFTMAIALAASAVLMLAPEETIAARLAAAPEGARLAIAGIAIISVAELYLCLRFAVELRRIIETVAGGDPFVPENADRLGRMAWLALGSSVLILAIAPLAVWLAPYLPQLKGSPYVPFGGFALALTLFLLARVFRHGAAMREDLEGTV
ncbi:MAG TPA: DUF2975 domain-containing protein, partial [Sphingomonas sp.]|nr:DUF2975 domain-containing protein [Sphingomonas sp.]